MSIDLDSSRDRAGVKRTVAPEPGAQDGWNLATLSGRLSELCGWGSSAVLTLAFRLVWDAQRRGEPVAWITCRGSAFFPPDVLESGVDLDALAVVRVAEVREVLCAADHLARSGAFGLLVLDLEGETRVPMASQSRLLGLARKHDLAILFLVEAPPQRSSLGSLISLRAVAQRRRLEPGSFACQAQVVKDKRKAPGWVHAEVCRGSPGLR